MKLYLHNFIKVKFQIGKGDKLIFGYARVSSKEQNVDRQLEALIDYENKNGLSIDKIFIDKVSGKDFDREQYKKMKEQLRPGDIIIIKELDRLGRNMEQVKVEWQQLQESKIEIIIIDMPILSTSSKTTLENTLISNVVFELLSYMAEKERVKIHQRQAEGIRLAKQKGQHMGRPPIEYPSNFKEVYKKWKDRDITAVRAMEELDIKRSTFYNLVKKYETIK